MHQKIGRRMYVWVLCVLGGVVLMTVQAAQGTLILDQSYDDTARVTSTRGAYYWSSGYRFVGQSFVPDLDNIVRIEYYIKSAISPDTDVTLSLYEAPSHYPTGSVLASVTVSSSTIGSDYVFYGFDLPQTSLTIGQRYAFVLSLDSVHSSGTITVPYEGKNTAAYGPGRIILDTDGAWSTTYGDAFFRTYGVPEPATIGLLAAGFATLCLRRGRR